jgi:hypothetical protein
MAVFTGLGSAASPSITFSADTNTGIFSPGADTLAFTEGGVEAARIDSSGRLLVGTSTSVNVGAIVGTTQQIAGSNQPLSLRRFSNSVVGPNILFGKTRATTDATYTIVQNGDTLGGLIFAGSDGVDLETPGASIVAQVDGTPGSNDMPGRLVFSTTADGSASLTERMMITNAGSIRVGGTLPSAPNATISSAGAGVFQSLTSAGALSVFSSGNPGAFTFVGRPTIVSTGANQQKNNGETLDTPSLGGAAFVGLLLVTNVLVANAGIRTSTVFFISGRLTAAATITPISTVNGTTGGAPFTITNASTGSANILRYTNNFAGLCNVTMTAFVTGGG